MATNQDGVDDMVELAEISEKAIAANLNVRLKKETIYVSNINTPGLYPHLQKIISLTVPKIESPEQVKLNMSNPL